MNATSKRRYRATRERDRAFTDALKAVPCMDCGGLFPPECMDFDHVRGEKLFPVSSMHGRSQARLLEEIAKCDIVCANCHRIRTRQRLPKAVA